ncbi:hypothetical protein ACJ73_00081 [Blastomyces percursus]|uniref:Cyanovirin-N domain-containing protein n=1 Tax=Blastomyces percursus TaxID=1658174 RepID=A0A1J9RLP3_9EURO|nr:hypothetical protein ACJ73_00081 [Blastomyces percursus]
MRLSVPAFIALLSFGTNALAAECYGGSGGYPCATVAAARSALGSYCANHFGATCTDFIHYNNPGGEVWIGHIGPFSTAAECYYAGDEILRKCYGHNDGGYWTRNKKHLNLNYCKWKK